MVSSVTFPPGLMRAAVASNYCLGVPDIKGGWNITSRISAVMTQSQSPAWGSACSPAWGHSTLQCHHALSLGIMPEQIRSTLVFVDFSTVMLKCILNQSPWFKLIGCQSLKFCFYPACSV
ncbi:hypothetical protein ElyMa_000610300 [Elysia marginata]|uniref:Uncharacterized protein n=1 Tax=Elysia marginata TaxID=1093978 RepID=A0AAV4G7U4_9GAST|nr:hypothetical protein ElyMa_000610300 [Elysia marginata]